MDELLKEVLSKTAQRYYKRAEYNETYKDWEDFEKSENSPDPFALAILTAKIAIQEGQKSVLVKGKHLTQNQFFINRSKKHWKDEGKKEKFAQIKKILENIDWYNVCGGTCNHRFGSYKEGIACKTCIMHDCKLEMQNVLSQLNSQQPYAQYDNGATFFKSEKEEQRQKERARVTNEREKCICEKDCRCNCIYCKCDKRTGIHTISSGQCCTEDLTE